MTLGRSLVVFGSHPSGSATTDDSYDTHYVQSPKDTSIGTGLRNPIHHTVFNYRQMAQTQVDSEVTKSPLYHFKVNAKA